MSTTPADQKFKKLSISMPRELFDTIEEMAATVNRTNSNLIATLLKEQVEKYELAHAGMAVAEHTEKDYTTKKG